MTTPNAVTHLSEADRQGLADGTLAAARIEIARAHTAGCRECASDVARLTALMTRIRAPYSTVGRVDDLWPDIRARIDRSKVVPLNATIAGAAAGRRVGTLRRLIAVGAVAAALIVMAITMRQRDHNGHSTAVAVDTASFINVADSSHAYEEEARALMNELEMRRSMLRPQTASSIDGDLRTIDDAITETRQALVADPNNPALRRLLASSYKQKVELLKRANNAG
jgi:hypothetical protein